MAGAPRPTQTEERIMTVAPRPLRLAALLGFITLLGGCTPPNALRNFDGDPWVKRNAEALDRMGTLLNEYGTVGMSAPLIMIPDKSFEFDLPEQGPTDYFRDAKSDIQARAAAVEQEVSLLSLNASATIDPVKRAAAAANIAAAKLRFNTALKAAEQLEDPKQRADAQAKAGEDYAAALKANTGEAPAAQDAQGDASKGASQAQSVIPEAYKKFIEPVRLLGTSPAVTPPTARPSSWLPVTPRWKASSVPCTAPPHPQGYWANRSSSRRRWCRSRQAGAPARTLPPG